MGREIEKEHFGLGINNLYSCTNHRPIRALPHVSPFSSGWQAIGLCSAWANYSLLALDLDLEWKVCSEAAIKSFGCKLTGKILNCRSRGAIGVNGVLQILDLPPQIGYFLLPQERRVSDVTWPNQISTDLV